jgi:hypothetical protein
MRKTVREILRKVTITAVILSFAAIISSCSSEPPGTASDNASPEETNDTVQNLNIDILPQNTPVTTAAAADLYTFEMSGFGDNYIITAESVNGGKALVFTVEDNSFNSTVYEMAVPEGFTAGVLGKSNCFVIKAPKNNPDVPDILQVNFTSDSGGKPVASFYGVRSRMLVPVGVYTTIPYNLSEMSYCEDTVLIRTEDYKFMAPPQTTWDSENIPASAIFTYTFDPNRMSLTKAAERLTPENQLYYAYGILGTAGDVASIFTTKNLNVESETEFVSVVNPETGESEHYFMVDDPRFSTADELIAFANTYFAPEITSELYKNAPQKFRDINGRLYTQKITTASEKKFPVITDILAEDTDLSVLLAGGGNIIISIKTNGEGFLIVKYSLV